MTKEHDDAKAVLDALTEEDKIITVNLKIKDSKKAQDLMATMHNINVEKLGVEVQSWGFCNILLANELQLKAIQEENERHEQAMRDILYKTPREYIKDNE